MIALVLGTRPEAIKLWPVIEELERRGIAHVVLSTHQQPDLLPPLLDELRISGDACVPFFPRFDRNVPLAARLGASVEVLANAFAPELHAVVVQGDTMSALAGALAASAWQIPVAHVEAGLRTYAPDPFPEELNRQLIARCARWHFAPTEQAARNLRNERVAPGTIHVGGNTIVDAARLVQDEAAKAAYVGPGPILVTFHRREAWDRRFDLGFELGKLRTPVRWVLHPNFPEDQVGKLEGTAIEFVPPMGYRDFLAELMGARCVVTDSGGVIEEATTLGRPLVIVRDRTERPEALESGSLVRLDDLAALPSTIEEAIAKRPRPRAVFGDGRAAQRIVGQIAKDLEGLRR